jgi:hypothetical protein
MQRTIVLRNDTLAEALWTLLRNNWRAMAAAGKPLAVTVCEHKTKRTLAQNSRLHPILEEIAEQAWIGGKRFDMEVWKEHYRRKFIGTEEIDMPDGTRLERGISTTTLDVAEFSSFMDRIQADATSELGVTFSQ